MARTLDSRPLPRRSTAAPRACRARTGWLRAAGSLRCGRCRGGGRLVPRCNSSGACTCPSTAAPAGRVWYHPPTCGSALPCARPQLTRMRVSTTDSTPAPAAASAALRHTRRRLAAGGSSFTAEPQPAAAGRFSPTAGVSSGAAAAAPATPAAGAAGAGGTADEELGRSAHAAGVEGGGRRLTARVRSGAARCGSPRASHSSVQPCKAEAAKQRGSSS